jgi:tetratricopeptide (TPR) repeat protein
MKPTLSSLAVVAVVLAISLTAVAQKATSKDPMERALAALQAGDNVRAIAEVTDVIKLRPGDPDAYLLRSNLRAITGDNSGALADISRVIELRPAMGSAYYGRAIMRMIANDLDGALKDLDSAVVNNYRQDHVYDMRATMRSQRGDVKGALSDMDEAIKINPGNPRYYLTRAELLLKLEDSQRAFADFDYVLKWYETNPVKRPLPKPADPGDKPAPGESASINDKKVKEVAPDAWKVAVAVQTENESPADKEMAPAIADAYVNRGLIYSSRGNADVAISDFGKSLRINPLNAWALYFRAVEFEGKGELVGALADVSRAVELDPNNGNCRAEHGVLLLLLGRSREAQADFDMLLDSDRVVWQKRIDERIAAVRKKITGVAH